MLDEAERRVLADAEQVLPPPMIPSRIDAQEAVALIRAKKRSVVWPQVLGSLWSDRITRDHIAAELHVPTHELESILFRLVDGKSNARPGERGKNMKLVSIQDG